MKKSSRFDPLAPEKLLGIRNTVRPERQPWGACADAVNVLIDDTYAIEQRPGYRLAAALTDATDVYSPPQGHALFVVNDDGRLLVFFEPFTGDPKRVPMPTALVEDLLETRFAWCELGDRVFYAGHSDCGIVVNGQEWHPLRIPVPVFEVKVENGSGRAAGQYQVTMVYRHVATGIEGPAAPVVRIDLAAGKKFTVGYPEGYEHPNGFETCLYVSEPDGTVLLHNGVPLGHERRDTQPFPEGVTALAAYGGVLYAATYDETNQVSFIFWSQWFDFQYWNLATDYVAVAGEVLALEVNASGLVIVTDRGCWVYANEMLNQLADYGGVPGRPIAYDRSGIAWIWTTRGLCALTPEGWLNLTEKRVSVAPGTWCTAMVLSHWGGDYFIVATGGAGTPANAYGNRAPTPGAYCVNLRTGELTRFFVYSFLAFARLGPVHYGLKAGGLYALDGDTDEPETEPREPLPIRAAFLLHPTNFGDTRLKRVTYAYVTGCDDTTATVACYADSGEVGSYSGRRRITLSRGVESEFWGFAVNNSYGGELRVTRFEVLVEPLSRRV